MWTNTDWNLANISSYCKSSLYPLASTIPQPQIHSQIDKYQSLRTQTELEKGVVAFSAVVT